MPDTGYFALALAGSERSETTSDRLRTPSDAGDWLRGLGLVQVETGLRSPAEARTVWTEARRLRTAVRSLFIAHATGATPDPRVLHALTRVLERSAVRHTLRAGEDGLELVNREVSRDPVAVLAPIARSAVKLVSEVPRARLKECDAVGCTTWFVDTSRGGRRRWCSMATCGNRAKAARHRRRAAAAS